MLKLIYLNCTAVAPHIGCMAVTDSHLRAFTDSGLEVGDIIYSNFPWSSLWLGDRQHSVESCLQSEFGSRLAAADIVVMNGEGTLHHGPGLGLLVAISTARELGKPTYLVNTSVFAVEGFDDVLSSLDDLNVRENESSCFLEERKIPHRLVLDSFLGANFSNEVTSDLSGKTVVTDWHPARDKDVGRATLGYLDSQPAERRLFFPLNHYSHVHTWRHTVANLSTADSIVTGRYHGVYLAGLAGRPFVALPSNTRKIEGLIQASGIPLPLCLKVSELSASVKYGMANPSMFCDFQAFLKEQLPLTTFLPLVESKSLNLPSVDPADSERTREELEARIDSARIAEQYKTLLSQSSYRVEMTHLKQLQKISLMGLYKIRKKLGL